MLMTEVLRLFLCSNLKEIKGTKKVFITIQKTVKKFVLNRYFEYLAKTIQKINKESRRNLKSMANPQKIHWNFKKWPLNQQQMNPQNKKPISTFWRMFCWFELMHFQLNIAIWLFNLKIYWFRAISGQRVLKLLKWNGEYVCNVFVNILKITYSPKIWNSILFKESFIQAFKDFKLKFGFFSNPILVKLTIIQPIRLTNEMEIPKEPMLIPMSSPSTAVQRPNVFLYIFFYLAKEKESLISKMEE